MLTIESATATAVRFSAVAGRFDGGLLIPRNKFERLACNSFQTRKRFAKNRVKASAEKSSSGSGPLKQNAKPQRYHPSEDISDSEYMEAGEPRLRPAETTRTIIEVNSKATLMFSGLVSEEVHHNIFWPNLPYVTDEHGNIYFQAKNGDDVLQSLSSEDNVVQVIVGLDTAELMSEMEALSRSEHDFDIEDIDDEDSDSDDDEEEEDDEDEENEDDSYGKDWVDILDDDDDENEEDDEYWENLETTGSSHPMYFAKRLAEVVFDGPVDFMDQPPAGLIIQGLLRPAFIEEHPVIQKHVSDHQSSNANTNQISESVEDKEEEDLVIVNGHRNDPGSSLDKPIWTADLEKDEIVGNGTTFYKLEMIKIQLVSAHGHQTSVEVEDFRRAQPDAIAHSAAKILSRLKAGGEKTAQALQSFCWRCMGIQAEEAALVGVDSLGFDLRVCSGIQVQTLRFSFKKRASSEYSAERQLNDLLFPRIQNKPHKKKEAHQTEL